MILEATQHQYNAFITLTYSEENLPITSDSLPTLIPKHFQDWLKRFRKAIQPSRVRYYGVGEYGEQTQRPHYHAALFGYNSCLRGQSDYKHRLNCCSQCDLIRDTWGFGAIHCGTLETNSAQYIAGYVTKKMTSKDDIRLKGRYPEFSRMSLKPGIGYEAMEEAANTILTFNLENREVDVPSSLSHGRRSLPLGRYLRRRLRQLTLGSDGTTPEAALEKIREEMSPVRLFAFNNSQPFKKVAVEEDNQKILNMEAKQKIFKQKRDL